MPAKGRLIPAWDLRVVLDALTEPPFEPLSGLGWELLSLKTVFLLAIASAKRVSELRALSVHPACLRLGGEGSAISLLPNLAFLPKVLPHSFVTRPLVLDPFRPPPHESPERARLHLGCPVRALRSYIARTSSIRQTYQLFVCFGESVRGQAVSKQRLARWVVRAIELAYSSAGLAPPTGVVAHSTRGMAASWALFRGASLEEVCRLGFLTDICQVLSPECSIFCGGLCSASSRAPLMVLVHLCVGMNVRVFMPGGCVVHYPSFWEFPSFGIGLFVPRKGGLGLPWVVPPPLGSPPDVIRNSVDSYCGVLTDMK